MEASCTVADDAGTVAAPSLWEALLDETEKEVNTSESARGHASLDAHHASAAGALQAAAAASAPLKATDIKAASRMTSPL
ncbi:hypothetical protein cyc_08307, partial [Cyclospora cayetanensis]